jgi:hypothetical protein
MLEQPELFSDCRIDPIGGNHKVGLEPLPAFKHDGTRRIGSSHM